MQSPQAMLGLMGLLAVALFLGTQVASPTQQVAVPGLFKALTQTSNTAALSVPLRPTARASLSYSQGTYPRLVSSVPPSVPTAESSLDASLPLLMAGVTAIIAPLAVWLRLRQFSQPPALQSIPLLSLAGETNVPEPAVPKGTFSRRSMGPLVASAIVGPWLAASPSLAAIPLSDCLYNILRVQEASQQEKRLINTGLYKDVQRANVKLAVRMLLDNYRLGDVFVSATTYIPDPLKQAQAGQVGRSVIESLYTILEYFDAAIVDNLQVGEELYGNKRALVIGGLDSVSQKIDEFLTYFPKSEVQAVRDLIATENELNRLEYPEDLGQILNVDPK